MMNSIGRHPNTLFSLRTFSVKALALTIGAAGTFTVFNAPALQAATPKQSSELVAAKLDRACSALDRYTNKTPAATFNAAREFRGLIKLFTAYSTSLKTINPASPAEADALNQLRNYVSFVKAESTVLLKLVSAKKTAQAGTDRTGTFLTTGNSLSKAVRSTFTSVSLPLCETITLDDGPETASGPADVSPLDLSTADVNAVVGSILSQPTGANGRLDVSDVYFPSMGGLSYRTTPEFDGVANQVASATKNIYAAVSVKELVDGTATRFCLIAGFQFVSTVDQPTRTRAVNTAAGALNTKELSPINGYRVFIGGVAQFDKAFLYRGDIFLEISFPPTSDRSAITKFVGEFAPKLPVA
jgi:hypothetical protein